MKRHSPFKREVFKIVKKAKSRIEVAEKWVEKKESVLLFQLSKINTF